MSRSIYTLKNDLINSSRNNVKKFLRPTYKFFLTFYRDKSWHIRNRKRAVSLANDFVYKLNSQKPEKIEIYFDNNYSPPTYGDFYIILMLANFFNSIGFEVNFILLDYGRKNHVWSFLDEEEQDEFVNFQVRMAESFLNKEIHFRKSNIKLGDFHQEIIHDLQTNTLALGFGSFYQVASYFLPKIIENLNLDYDLVKSSFKQVSRESSGYITWNVRVSKWAANRNTDEKSLLKDYCSLREKFPHHDIHVLSTPSGISFAFDKLFASPPRKIDLGDGCSLVPQVGGNFISAAKVLLSSDFFFQRKGGGLLAVALFSNIPFLHFNYEKTNLYSLRKTRVFPWSGQNQIFVKVNFFRFNRGARNYLRKL